MLICKYAVHVCFSVMSNEPPFTTSVDNREGGKTFFSKRSRGFVKALAISHLDACSLGMRNP